MRKLLEIRQENLDYYFISINNKFIIDMKSDIEPVYLQGMLFLKINFYNILK